MWEAELELAVRAAREAGEFLRAEMRGPKRTLPSQGKDVKLEVDVETEKLILRTLGQGSDYPVLAEESGETGAIESGPCWVVDPLDGTANYLRGVPMCCVSIALMDGERAVLGVIYDFNRGELFAGRAGGGATLNDAPMFVSGVKDVGEAFLCTGFPTHRDYGDDAVKEFVELVQKFKKVRMLGSAALMLAYVACGRVDAYVEEDIMLWDVAAGVALIEAAGGFVSVEETGRKKWARLVRCASSSSVWE